MPVNLSDENFVYHVQTSSAPAIYVYAVTKSDSTVLDPRPRALYVGTAGDVVIDTEHNTDVTFKSVPAGTILPVRATKVKAATSAADIVALR